MDLKKIKGSLRRKPIPGFDGYFTTKVGNVFSNKTGEVKKLKPWLNRKGYPTVGLSEDGKMHSIPVHKVQERTFMGGPKPGLQIDHIDGDKTNNHVDNLRQVTGYENTHNPITEKRKLDVITSPEYRERLHLIMQEKFKDPDYRERVKEAAQKRLADPKWQENHAKAMKEVWSRPYMQKQMWDNLEKMNNDPEMRKYNAERSREVNSRKCKAISKDGEVKMFNSMTECAKCLNLSPDSVRRIAKEKLTSKTGWKIEKLEK